MDRRHFLEMTGMSTLAAAVAACSKPAATVTELASYTARELATYDTVGQSELFRKGEVSALELVEAAIERIEILNPKLNCAVFPAFDRARQTAANANPADGPFAGVPYLMKCTSNKKGQPSTQSATFLKDQIAEEDSHSEKVCESLGLHYLGQASAPEFALLPSTQSLLLGVTRNPWGLDRNVAGSSGGSAAAVAAGMVPFATADDGAGSTRMPGSLCGVIGFKYSRLREHSDREGLGPIINSGCETRGVRDQAIFLDAMEVKDNGYNQPIGLVEGPSSDRLRIAWSYSGINGGLPSHPHVIAAIEETARQLEGLGHHVEEARFEINGEEFWHHFMVYWTGAGAQVAALARQVLGREATPEDIDVWNRGLAANFAVYGADAFEKANQYFLALRESYQHWMSGYDLQLTPVVSTPPDLLSNQEPFEQDYARLKQAVMDFCNFTPMHNAMGLPSCSLPLSQSPENLPIGNLVSGAPGAERKILELAYELEEALPWNDRWAPYSING